MMDSLFDAPEDDHEKWREYERRKRELIDLPPKEYEKAIKRICNELGI